jgi:hypothetical protein
MPGPPPTSHGAARGPLNARATPNEGPEVKLITLQAHRTMYREGTKLSGSTSGGADVMK